MRCSLLLVLLLASGSLMAVDGPGVPDRTYPANHVHKIIGHAYVPHAGKTRFVTMHNGYLLFQSMQAHKGKGALSVFDISDPYHPVLKFTTNGGEGFGPTSTGHGVSENIAVLSGLGKTLRMFDLSDTTAPREIVKFKTHAGTHATNFIQWPYLYAGGDAYGAGTADTVDVEIFDLRVIPPVLVRTLTRKEIGFRGTSVCIAGNLMSLFAGGNADGGAFFDISDPLNPVLLSRPTVGRSYGGWMCGDQFFGGYQVYDISDPTNPRFLSTANDNGYYPQFQKRLCFTKAFDRHSKLALRWVDMDTQQVHKVSLSYAPGADIKVPLSTIGNETEMPVGNLVVTGDYGNNLPETTSESGAFLIPISAAIDTSTPEVVNVVPRAGSVNQKLTSRIGLIFDKHIDNRTVAAPNILVRPVGGSAIAGRFSLMTNIVNFTPAQPLLANTTYEVVVKAGGVKDCQGHAIVSQWSSRFSTGGSVDGTTPPTVTLTAPTRLAYTAPATITLASDASDADGIDRVEFLRDGVVIISDITAPYGVTWTGLPAGSYVLRARAVDTAGASALSQQITVTVSKPANQPPTVTFPAPSGSPFTAPATITLTATASDDQGVARVEFLRNGAVLGSDGTAPYAITWTDAAAGSYDVSARAVDITGLTTTSPTRRVTVAAPTNRTPTISALAASPTLSLVNASVTFTASASDADGDALRYAWDFGDGSSQGFTTAAQATHVYTQPGHYLLRVRVDDGRSATPATREIRHTSHRPLVTGATSSSTIIHDAARGRVWCVNTDSDTVTCIDAITLAKLLEVPVGDQPRTLAQAGDGTVWVACQGDDSIRILDGGNGAELHRHVLAPGSGPWGIAPTPDGTKMLISSEYRGRLVLMSVASRSRIGNALLGLVRPRAIAITADGATALVTRMVSPADRGEVHRIDLATWTAQPMIPLALDTTRDDENQGRGVPNYLTGIAISPDGLRAWIAGKKDNTGRGQFRDGQPLTFENTVRAIITPVALGTVTEDIGSRVDLDNSDAPAAVALSPRGDWIFVALQGSNRVAVVDAYSGARVVDLSCGAAPQGLCLDAAGSRLYVQDFLGRSITVHDVAALTTGTALTTVRVGTVPVVAAEPLSPQVLLGKRIFYHAADPRMSLDGYLSCATCHLDGGHDGRVWDFTDRGEGLRNTTDLRGRRGLGHGRVHWSANFDEIQDFEHDIRGAFRGTGFLSDTQFNSGSRNTPLGSPKAGVGAELDALAAYVASLDRHGRSPFRNGDGSLTADGVAGRAIFAQLGCATCHGGTDFTDSASGVLHDVGTITSASGKRLGAALTGIDTPTLRGLWLGAPYLHDGSATSLLDVVARGGPAHGGMSALDATRRGQLVAYLLQIDDGESAPPAPVGTPVAAPETWTSGDIGAVGRAGSSSHADGVFTITGSGSDIWNSADEFRFVRTSMAGDGSIVAQVQSLQRTDDWAKAGVMIRDGDAAGARHVMVCATGAKGVSFQHRAVANQNCSYTPGPAQSAPVWLRLERSGDRFTAASSADGTTWTHIGQVSIPMAAEVSIGLAVTSHRDGTPCTAVIGPVVTTQAGSAPQ